MCVVRTGLLLLALLAGWFASAGAQEDSPACHTDRGTVITESIESAALGQSKEYRLYLPPGWCDAEALPLLVMLHGLHGDHTDWTNRGQLHLTADRLIALDAIAPLIILMPDGDDSFYVPGPDGDYERYIVDELIGQVAARYPVADGRENRFIGGLSMGGYGALYLGLRHADQFSAIGAHSAAVPGRNEAPFFPEWLFGADLSLYEERDPVTLIRVDGWPDEMRLFVDVGSSDPLVLWSYERVVQFLIDRRIPHEAHLWPGGHDWDYWSAHAGTYLRFYAGTDLN
ncbi:MAG: hypothetical protein GXY36_10735 [Chloroflexi bacterium]|nr:hypothetical protein [Chloroflexota bacterium]